MAIYFQPGIYWLHPNAPESKPERQRASLPARAVPRPSKRQRETIESLFSRQCPIRLIVPNALDRRRSPQISCRVIDPAQAQNSFIPLGDSVFAACPELALLLEAPSLNDYELLYCAYELCAEFVVDPSANSGLRKRNPLTSVEKLSCYMQARQGVSNSKRVLRLLKYVQDGARSPREIECMIQLGLPHWLGGCNIKGLQLNQRIKLKPGSSAVHRYCDIYLPKSQTAIEYLGIDYHSGAYQMLADAQRTIELAKAGVQVIQITKNTIESASQLNELAKTLAAKEDCRFRPRASTFSQKQSELRRIVLRHQGSYFARKTWLSG